MHAEVEELKAERDLGVEDRVAPPKMTTEGHRGS